MSRTVSIFFSRDVTGFSEPGTCPRCSRSVNCGGQGNPKAHKCPHGVWCSRTFVGCQYCPPRVAGANGKAPPRAKEVP
jgi:hypothetical protein